MPADSPASASTTHDPELFDAAREVQRHAHAPYSNFLVGAAIRTSAGNVYAACNVENAAFPQSLCAEASAIAAMVAAGERSIDAILTVCDTDDLATSCGGCRQKIREFAHPGTIIHAAGPDGIRKTYTMDELLPDSFGPEHLR